MTMETQEKSPTTLTVQKAVAETEVTSITPPAPPLL